MPAHCATTAAVPAPQCSTGQRWQASLQSLLGMVVCQLLAVICMQAEALGPNAWIDQNASAQKQGPLVVGRHLVQVRPALEDLIVQCMGAHAAALACMHAATTAQHPYKPGASAHTVSPAAT